MLNMSMSSRSSDREQLKARLLKQWHATCFFLPDPCREMGPVGLKCGMSLYVLCSKQDVKKSTQSVHA